MAKNYSSPRQCAYSQFYKKWNQGINGSKLRGHIKIASGEVVILNFAEKLKENVEKNINENVDYANPETETDLNLTSLFDDQKINVKLFLNINGVELRNSSACSAYLFGLLLLIFR